MHFDGQIKRFLGFHFFAFSLIFALIARNLRSNNQRIEGCEIQRLRSEGDGAFEFVFSSTFLIDMLPVIDG